MMVSNMKKYFLLSCCSCFALIVIYQKMTANLTKRFLFRDTVPKLATTFEPPALSLFPNISKSAVTEASSSGIYVFTAFKRLLERNQTGIFINGWEARTVKKMNTNVHCCFLLPTGVILSSLAASDTFLHNTDLSATLYMCNAPQGITLHDHFAVSVTLVDKQKSARPGSLKQAAPMVPPKQGADAKKPGPPVKQSAPGVAGNQRAPVMKKMQTDQLRKPVPPQPPRKPMQPKQHVKRPNPVSAKQNPAHKHVQNTKDVLANKGEILNSSNPLNVNAKNNSLTSKKLMSTKSSLSDNSKLSKTDTAVKQTVPKAESQPVIKAYSNIVCPTHPNSYVIPFEAINVETVTNILNALDESHKPEEKENVAYKDPLIKDSKIPVKQVLKGNGPPAEKNFSFAICAKIIYGQADVELIIEWMEYYRRMGTSKVLAFTYNLTETAQRVIRHYEDMGFLETLPFQFPMPDNPKRSVGQKNKQVWNDEHVTVYHCHDRLINYKFVGVLDFDEFIIPHKDRNFRELFTRLLKSQKFVSEFIFPHMVHVQEWNKTRQDSLKITSYLDHTKNLGYALKAVYLPDRVIEGKVWSHGLLAHKAGMRALRVPGTIAQLSHYRMKCRREWVKESNCFNKTLVRTTRIMEIVDKDLRTTIQKKKKLILDIN